MTIQHIERAVTTFTGITSEQIRSRNRKRELVYARYLFIYFAWKYSGWTQTAIVEYIGLNRTMIYQSTECVRKYRHTRIKVHYNTILAFLTEPMHPVLNALEICNLKNRAA